MLLDFLITPAYAQAAPGGLLGGDLVSFLPLIAIFVVFYFLLIRPSRRKRRKRARCCRPCRRATGRDRRRYRGYISKLGEQYATLEIATVE